MCNIISEKLKLKKDLALQIALSDMILRFEDGLSEADIQDLIDNSTEAEIDNYIFSAI